MLKKFKKERNNIKNSDEIFGPITIKKAIFILIVSCIGLLVSMMPASPDAIVNTKFINTLQIIITVLSSILLFIGVVYLLVAVTQKIKNNKKDK